MSGVTTVEKTVTQDGRTVKLYVMTPQQQGAGKPGILFFVHGGVWIVGNFENHQRLLRDLVVGSGRIGVFVEYTPLPAPRRPNPTGNRAPRGRTIVKHGMGSGKGTGD